MNIKLILKSVITNEARDVRNYIFLITILKRIKFRASESVYCTTKRHWWFESFDQAYNQQRSRHCQFDSKIFESAHPFRIELDGRFEFESRSFAGPTNKLVL